MTIRERLRASLVSHGLFETDADAVIRRFEDSDLSAPVRTRLDDREEDYPAQALTAIWGIVRRLALKWIDDTCPEHWARAMFT